MGPSASINEGREQHKPWYRPRNIVLFVIVLVAVPLGYELSACIALMNAEPSPSHDYRAEFVNEVLTETGVDAVRAREAWDTMVNALTSALEFHTAAETVLARQHPEETYVERFKFDIPTFAFDVGLHGPRVHSALDRERALLNEIREAGVFEQLDRFVELAPGVDARPIEGPIYYVTLPYLRSTRLMRDLLLFRARLAIEDGDHETFVQSLSASMAIAHSLAWQGYQINRFIATTFQSAVAKEIIRAVDDHAIDEAHCMHLLDVMDRFEMPAPIWTVRAGRLEMLDLVQHVFTDDGEGEGYMLIDRAASILEGEEQTITLVDAFAARHMGATRSEMVNAINRYFDQLETEIAKAPIDRWSSFDPEAPSVLSSDQVERFMASSAPPWRRAFDNEVLAQVCWAGAKIVLQIERYHARTGRLPESLMDVEGLLGVTLPIDPIHSEPFRYQLLDAPEENGRSYLLYSIGFDRTDDGGVQPEENEFLDDRARAARDRTSSGIDFVLNQPRHPWPEGLHE